MTSQPPTGLSFGDEERRGRPGTGTLASGRADRLLSCERTFRHSRGEYASPWAVLRCPRVGERRTGAVQRMDLLESWRLRVVLPHVRGRLLDLACGYNNLTRAHGAGLGADVFPWEGIDVRIGDAARLPFRDGSFDTVSVLAALNHIPNREAALGAVMRVLRPGGVFLVTMIGPATGRFAHLLFHQDETRRGGMRQGELQGIRPSAVRALLQKSGFELVQEVPFQLGLNRLYIAKPGRA